MTFHGEFTENSARALRSACATELLRKRAHSSSTFIRPLLPSFAIHSPLSMNTDELTTPQPVSSFAQALTFGLPSKSQVCVKALHFQEFNTPQIPTDTFQCLLCSTEEPSANSVLEHLVYILFSRKFSKFLTAVQVQTHNVVIADVNKIADLPKYVQININSQQRF